MEILSAQRLMYLSRRKIEIEELKQSLVREDFEIAVNIGHRLKGNGETFGFPVIGQIGIELESAGKTKNKVKLKNSIDQLSLNVEENLKKIQ